ncbi:MAG: TRAP transporter substrate-binding protein DctP [Burkholderiales bacterium]|nr:TRAP transporter substrate-binding protein DctP [Burkholderiales bacterium]
MNTSLQHPATHVPVRSVPLLRVLGAAALVTVAAAWSSTHAVAAEPTLTIKMAWYIPPGTAVDKQGNAIAKKIEEMSHGSIKVLTYPGGSLLKETNMARGLQDNVVQMGILGVHWWANQEPSTSFDNIPFLARNSENLLDALHGKVGEDIKAILGKHGVTVAGWGFYGYTGAYINVKHPVIHPEDFNGLRMRSNGPLPAAFLKHFGAVPTTIDSSEVYTALQRGTLEGAASGMSTFVSRKWIEVGKYITALKSTISVYPTQVNAAWWNGLKPEQRKIIADAVASTERDNAKAIEDEWQNDVQIARSRGLKVFVPQGDALKEWESKSHFLQAEYLKTAGEQGQKILRDIASYVE